MKIKLTSAIMLAMATSLSAQAAVVYDESISGDLSSDNLNPTSISLSAGDNIISGNVIAAPGDRDFWTVTIANDQSLDAIILDQFVTTEDRSFFAVEQGPQITAINSAATYLGSALVGAGAGASQGDDILDDLGGAIFGGSGFIGALGPGTYTFWFQETAAEVDYSLNFQVSQVPVPAAAWLFGSALVGLAGVKRKQ